MREATIYLGEKNERNDEKNTGGQPFEAMPFHTIAL